MKKILLSMALLSYSIFTLQGCSSSSTGTVQQGSEHKPIEPVSQTGRTIKPPPVTVTISKSFKPVINPAQLVSAHNKVRAKYRVPPVSWSPKLAAFSTQWAEQLKRTRGCKMKHRPLSGAMKTDYGENIYWSSAYIWDDGEREIQKVNAHAVVNEWAKEVKDYNYRANSCKPGRQCGHYRQVVWKNTKKVGCGLAVCGDKSQVWVCSYDPPGHYMGVRPY